MKKSTLLVVLMTLIYQASYAQSIIILNSNSVDISGDSLLTGSPFNLEAEIQIPAGCDSIAITISVPQDIRLDTNFPVEPTSTWESSNAVIDYNYNAFDLVVSSISGIFDNNSGSNSQNLNIDLRMNMGDLCEGVEFNFDVTVEYFENGMICPGSKTASEKIYSLYLEDYWEIDLIRETPDSLICTGGFVKYRLEIPGRSISDYGGYNSSNGFGNVMQFYTAASGVQVYNQSYQLVPLGLSILANCPFTTSGNTEWSVGVQIGAGTKRYYILESFECDNCDYSTTYSSASASYFVNQPCQVFGTPQGSDTESFDPTLFTNTCCGTYTGITQFNKYHNFNSTAICPGSCQSTSFGITFDNTLSGVNHTSLCINDDIPDDYDINSINFASSGDTYFSSGRTATLIYPGGAPYSLTAGNTSVTLADLGVPSLSNYSICYSNPVIALIDVLSINYSGSFTDQVSLGDVIAPCATIPSLGATACANTATISNCSPRFSMDFKVYNDLVGATNNISTNWGDKSTYRLRVQNNGTADAIDADLTYTIPSEFTFCSGGLRFYYVPAGSSLSSAVALPSPPAATGGTHSLVGQDFLLSDFDLDMTCQGGGTLYIEIDVETNTTAVAGPKVSRFYVNGGQSPATTIYVSEFYQIEANMYVQCVFSDCDPIIDTTAVTNPGGAVWYKYEIVNTGNVPLTGVEMINHKPTASNLLSDCSGTRDVTMQGLYFDTPYLLEPCGNTPSVTPTYSNTTGCATTFTDPFSATASNQKLVFGGTLMPGESFAAQVKHIIDQSEQLAVYTENDFTVSCIRNDVPGRTQPLLSNNTMLYVLPNQCGTVTTTNDIDCTLSGLTLTQDTIANVDSCCVSISVENNFYGDVFLGIDVAAITGELFDIVELAPGIIQGAGSNNENLYLQADNSPTLPLGTYAVATICYDPLYSDPQTITATYRGDINGSPVSDLCQSSIEMSCPAQEFEGGWSKYFGDNESQFAREVKSFGNHIYASSFIRTGSGSTLNYTPVFAKFDLAGNLIWQQEYSDENSILLDFEISEDMSEILAVGLTYPASFSDNNKSIFYRINTSDGALVAGEVFQDLKRERYSTIKKHQNPENPAYPYYILGVFDGGNDRVILKNINDQGAVNWETELDRDSDDQFFVTLIDKLNGDLVVGGDVAGNNGMILITIDGATGNVLASKKNNLAHYLTTGFDFGDGLAVAAFDNSNGNDGYLSIYDYDLNLLDAYRYDDLGVIRSFFIGEDGNYYAYSYNTAAPSGGGGGNSKPGLESVDLTAAAPAAMASYSYPVICRVNINVTQASPLVASITHDAAYKFTTGGNDFSSAYLWGGNLNHLFFNNTVERFKEVGNNAFGFVWDQQLGVLSYDLDNSNCVEAISLDTVDMDFTMSTTTVSNVSYTSPAPTLNTVSDSTIFLCDDSCNPTCLVRFAYSIDETYQGCGVKVDFTNLSTNMDDVWNWNFGNGTTSQVENPSVIYDGDGLYTVILGVPECQASYSLVVDATFDHSLPAVTPTTGVQVFCTDEACFYTGAISDLVWQYSGGNEYCIDDTTYLRSDGRDYEEEFEVGTTLIEVQISNSFGETTAVQFTVVVEDCTSPDITCPVDIVVEAPFNEGSTEVTWSQPWMNDDCSDVAFTQTAYSGQMFDCGDHEIIYTAYDEAGNSAQCTIHITVLCDSIFDYCGQAAITCFPGFVNGSPSQGIDMTAPVYGIVDVRDRSGVSPGLWADRSGGNIYHPAHWNADNLGLVFGMTIDNANNVYVAATTVYGCETTIFDAFTTAGPGAIYKIDENDNISVVVTTGSYDATGNDNKIPNNGGALGNIAFNPIHDMCYVTNLSDGHIYQIDDGGLVSNRFDPFAATATTSAAFAPLGDRPWGIAYNAVDNKLYYSNWVEDRGRRNTSQKNEIWSVDIDNNGDIIPGTDMLVIELPDHLDTYSPQGYQGYSNPVSDISFGENGKMLLAERSMGADCGDAARAVVNSTRKFSHGARVLEYRNACDHWILDDGFGSQPFDSYSSDLKFVIGNASKTITPTGTSGSGTAGANSAGGVDYGYASFIAGAEDADCDAMVWSSSDYMWECSNARWYGMQGTPASGGNECNSFLIDYDGLPGTEAKIMQGDVEVFRCFECAAPDLTCCSSFDGEDPEGWQSVNTTVLITETGPSVTTGDFYFRGETTVSGGYVYNDTDYGGDWTDYNGSCLCFDFRILDDGNFSAATVLSPDFRIYNGDHASPTLEARFTSFTSVTEQSIWTNFCSPITVGGGSTLPSSELGYWTMTIGSGVSDWNTLLQDISGIKYNLNLAVSPTQIYGLDNICIGDCSDIPDVYACNNVQGSSSMTNTTSDSCCFEFQYVSYDDTIVDGFKFDILSPGVTYATFATDGASITNNYIDPSITKGVASGDTFVLDVCFDSALPLPHGVQFVASSYHQFPNGEDYHLCSDTFGLTCQDIAAGSGCYSIVEVDVTCNDSLAFTLNGNTTGYDVAIKVKNETAGEIFSSLVLEFEDNDFYWNPTVVSLAPGGLAPGQTSDWLYFVMSPDQYFEASKDICFEVHPVNDDFDYCCTEPAGTCISFMPCCLAQEGLAASVAPSDVSAGGTCCYDLSLENSCAFGYIKSISASILTDGVTIHSHFDNDASWTTNSLSESELELWHTDGTLPLGSFSNLYTICLNNIEDMADVPQELELSWTACDDAGDFVVTTDTMVMTCQPVITDTCTTVSNDTLICNANTESSFEFTVTNTSPHTITQVALIPQNGTSASGYFPQTFTTALQSGASIDLHIDLAGSPGDVIEFRTRLFDNSGNGSQLNYCCYQQDMVSIALENCCKDTLVLDGMMIEDGDYYARRQIKVLSDVGEERFVNMYTPEVYVPTSGQVKQDAQVNIDPNGCFDDAALYFDGVDDRLRISPYTTTPDFTVGHWFRASDVSSQSQSTPERLFSLGNIERLEVGLYYGADDGKIWIFDQFGSDVDGGGQFFGSSLRDQQWHHIALTGTGDVRTLYVDGMLVHSYTTTAAVHSSQLNIGAWHGLNANYEGYIEDFKIWDYAMTDTEIATNYYCPSSAADTGLIFHYDFNEGIPEGDNTDVLEVVNQVSTSPNASLEDFSLTGSESNYVKGYKPIENCCTDGPDITCFKLFLSITDDITLQVAVNASDFIFESDHPCGLSETYSFSADVTDTVRVFDCADTGLSDLTIFATDENGQVETCSAQVTVTDPNGLCP